MNPLVIGNKEFTSRLFLGTGKFPSNKIMKEAIIASGTQMVTFAMKRVDISDDDDEMLLNIIVPGLQILPNTSGARTCREAIVAAQLAREAFQTNFIKLEIHPDPKYLLPDPIETLTAAKELVKDGFIVLPYINADPVLCKLLEDVGVAAVMPLGSPIGSNKGLGTIDMLKIIIANSNVPVVVDAGIGVPSDAAKAMEIGADAVLINTAIAIANDPVLMAKGFSLAVEAGRNAVMAGTGKVGQAASTSPLTKFLYD